jgi:hypothetical protein
LQQIDLLRVIDLRALQAHTWIGKDYTGHTGHTGHTAEYSGASANSLITEALLTQRFAGCPRNDAGVPVPQEIGATAVHARWADDDGLPGDEDEPIQLKLDTLI